MIGFSIGEELLHQHPQSLPTYETTCGYSIVLLVMIIYSIKVIIMEVMIMEVMIMEVIISM